MIFLSKCLEWIPRDTCGIRARASYSCWRVEGPGIRWQTRQQEESFKTQRVLQSLPMLVKGLLGNWRMDKGNHDEYSALQMSRFLRLTKLIWNRKWRQTQKLKLKLSVVKLTSTLNCDFAQVSRPVTN